MPPIFNPLSQVPMIENLSEQERFSLIKMIANIPFFQSDEQSNIARKRFNIFPNAIAKDSTEIATPLSREEIAKKRLGFFQGQMTMSDDFDGYLGDDFWFPEDDILYK